MKNLALTLLSLMALSQAARANVLTYQVPDNSQNMVKFSIPYTMGTHHGTVKSLKGIVHTTDGDEVLNAHFQVAIADMSTGNKHRDCHMREAMGIDYTSSHFPAEHVCNDNFELPETGMDSVRYPNVSVELVKIEGPFTVGVPKTASCSINIEIHGVKKTLPLNSVTITKTATGKGLPAFQVVTDFNLSLKDFDITVKPVQIGPVSVGVEDTVSISINALLVGN